jgi:hypothetical protein
MENITNDFLLFLMLSFYLFPIIYVYIYYDNNPSVSNIISNDDSKYIILFFMILMGITTILYEYKRNDIYSLIIISILLVSIYILIYFTEDHILHYIFASIAFISILLFMIRHCYRECNQNCYILFVLLYTQALLLLLLIVNKDDAIFLYEILYILNFAIFYFYIHNK